MGLVFESAAFDGALLAGALLLLLYLYFTRNFGYWRRRGVPYVEPTPFLGNMRTIFMLRSSIGDFARDLYRKMPDAPVVGFFIFDKPAVLVRKPELVKKVLVKDFNVFADRYNDANPHKDPIGQRNLFTIKGDKWKYLRMHLSPMFTSGKMKKMFQLVQKCDEQMIEYMENARGNKDSVNLDTQEFTAKCTTDVISSCAFGINSNCLSDPNAEFRAYGKKNFDYTAWRSLEVLITFLTPSLVKYTNVTFFDKDMTIFLRKVFWDVINAREKSNTKRNDLIDLLIELKNKGAVQENADDEQVLPQVNQMIGKQFDFSGDDLVSQAAVFFVAGFETSSSTMSFALYELALQPDLQTRLRNEIREELQKNNGKITYEMVFGMKYLDMVVSETLRIYPVLPFLDRVALRDYKDEDTGVTIQKGTPVYISVQGLQTDPKYYPNPNRFDPERFSDDGKKTKVPFTYMPFGEGPRNCIGMRFGLMSVKAGIIHILANYEVEPCAETPSTLVMNTRGLVLTIVGDLPLKFKKLNV